MSSQEAEMLQRHGIFPCSVNLNRREVTNFLNQQARNEGRREGRSDDGGRRELGRVRLGPRVVVRRRMMSSSSRSRSPVPRSKQSPEYFKKLATKGSAYLMRLKEQLKERGEWWHGEKKGGSDESSSDYESDSSESLFVALSPVHRARALPRRAVTDPRCRDANLEAVVPVPSTSAAALTSLGRLEVNGPMPGYQITRVSVEPEIARGTCNSNVSSSPDVGAGAVSYADAGTQATEMVETGCQTDPEPPRTFSLGVQTEPNMASANNQANLEFERGGGSGSGSVNHVEPWRGEDYAPVYFDLMEEELRHHRESLIYDPVAFACECFRRSSGKNL